MIRRHDPHQCCRILVLSAPPCPDFSVINEDGPGLQGQEGSKFTKFGDFMDGLEQELEGWHVDLLCENVVMQKPDEVQFVSSKLKAQPVAVDASDLGIINRPRLWWTRLAWKDLWTNPFTKQPFRWGSLQKLPRLFMDLPWMEPHHLDLEGHTLPCRVAKHECRLPCMTTPAPSSEGRPPPKKLRGKMRPDTKQRWLNDSRTFAPWHYDEEHMLRDSHGTLTLPTIRIKEQLQGLPPGFTAVGDLPLRSRHRMLGNAWNCTVAKFLLTLILLYGQAAPVTSRHLPSQPRQTALQLVMTLAAAEPHGMGPVQEVHSYLPLPPCDTMWDHWLAAHQAPHPLFCPPRVESGVQQIFNKLRQFGGDLCRLRHEVVGEVVAMMEDFEDTTSSWFAALPEHIQMVYSQGGRGPITQVPLFLHLLQCCNFPGMDDLREDLTCGFPLTGAQHHGPGWPPRKDDRYAHPISQEAFKNLNSAYIQQKIARRPIDPHWESLLDELLKEKAEGRITGPHQAPDHWKHSFVGVPGHPMEPAPTDTVLAAVCFSVQQSDKIRRCEDFRRSFHNSTLEAHDVPTHHTVDSYIHMCRHFGLAAEPSSLWTHDLDSAYRQFPIKDRSVAYTILFTPSGATLWCHTALCFGASASVWAFNRCADCLQYLARKILWAPVHHFVDDFGAVENNNYAMSGFQSFQLLFGKLGLKMKEKKACEPKANQKLLGVIVAIEDHQVSLRVCPDRLCKLQTQIDGVLRENRLSPQEAQRLAGKLVFLQTTSFGNCGRALTQPVYARAHGLGMDMDHEKLNYPLRSALMTLQKLLVGMKPRVVPFQPPCFKVVLYTDAFFAVGDRSYRPSDSDIPTNWNSKQAVHYPNGWGLVISFGTNVYVAHGVAPQSLIRKFCARRAYIYFLELLAPIIAFTLLASQSFPFVVAFVDNTASLAALNKGYGRDECINRMLSFLWCLLSSKGMYPHFTWVQSSHNVSDKVSRHDLSEAVAAGWRVLHLDVQPLYKILTRCADDMDYACSGEITDALSWAAGVAWL